jgi:hypothetical protein
MLKITILMFSLERATRGFRFFSAASQTRRCRSRRHDAAKQMPPRAARQR